MAYEWVEHTAEVELLIEAGSEEQVFADALTAVGELLDDGMGAHDADVAYDVTLTAPDRAALLAAWMDELVYRAEVDGLLPKAVERIELADDGLSAAVRARRGEPRPFVKAVTYHRLAFEPTADGWQATVVLDV